MPPLLDSRSTGQVDLTAQQGETNFLARSPSATVGYNGTYLGPTVVMHRGPLTARVSNTISEAITTHWHGLLIPGSKDGGGTMPITPGSAWNFEMDIDQAPMMAWYHSHPHGSTARHVYFGLAGAIHITDGRDDQRGLPSAYGIDDLTLIIQDRKFDSAGSLVYDPDPTDTINGFQGEWILVNGQFDATAVVPKGLSRLRVLNASNGRIYSLHFADRRPMHLVASECGWHEKPIELSFLRLSPGERAEVLVDFADGLPAALMNARGLSKKVLQFAVDDRLSSRIKQIPAKLDAETPESAPAEMRTRSFALGLGGNSTGHASHGAHGHGQSAREDRQAIGAGALGDGKTTVLNDFTINGRAFDHNRIDFEAKLGTYERWSITCGAGVEHPFHIHGVHFRVLSAGGAPPRPEDRGWKDTVVVNGEVQILVHFTQPASPEFPFMYHCHILEHEDAGMMGQFIVT
jgi:FtsP/CotA-like multicopper oxidase with cupredoxin domain